MSAPARFVPMAVCPECHWKPALRYYAATVLWARTLDPEELVENIQCGNRRCGAYFDLCADALQRALPEPAKGLAHRRRAA